MSLDNLSIAKSEYKWNSDIKGKVSKERWVEFIDNNKDYFTWLEDTDKGKKRLAGIESVPQSFREDILKSLNKSQACAEFNHKKGYHQFLVDHIEKYGKISVTSMVGISEKQLDYLFEMAEYLGALLLSNGKILKR